MPSEALTNMPQNSFLKQMKEQFAAEVEKIRKQKQQVLQQQQDQLTQILLQINKSVEAVQMTISEGSSAQVTQAKKQWEETEHQLKTMMENLALEAFADEYIEFIAEERTMKTLGSVHRENNFKRKFSTSDASEKQWKQETEYQVKTMMENPALEASADEYVEFVAENIGNLEIC